MTAIFIKQLLTVALLLIVPALWARLGHRVSPWALVLLAGLAYGGGLLFSGDAVSAIWTALLCTLPGAGLYLLQRLRLSNFRTVLYASFLTLAGLFCYVCVPDLIRYGDAYRSVRRILELYQQSLNGLNLAFAELGGSELLKAAEETVEMYRLSPEAVCVPFLLTASMAAGLSDVLFSHLFNRRGGAAITALPRFEDWRCERWYVILVAAFSLTVILLRLFGVKSAEGLSSVADVLWRMPCALAGLCTVRKFGIRLHRAWIFWIAIVALLTLPPVAILILTVVGMLSSLRPAKNVGEDGKR